MLDVRGMSLLLDYGRLYVYVKFKDANIYGMQIIRAKYIKYLKYYICNNI